MGDVLTTEKLGLALFFVTPGLIMLFVRNLFVSNRRPPLSEALLAYVALSVVYQALVFPIFEAWTDVSSESDSLMWLALLFAGPTIIGLLLGLNARAGWLRWCLNRVGVNLAHPIDSAWDWRFTDCPTCWVMVVLKDGTKWAGHLGENSFMSSDRGERDLYIEDVYQVGADDKWSPKGSGVWIAHGEVQTIEFWNEAKQEDENVGEAA